MIDANGPRSLNCAKQSTPALMFVESQGVAAIAIAALGGAAVGLEREWSGHTREPQAHFAGIRTFTLLGALAGISGWIWVFGLPAGCNDLARGRCRAGGGGLRRSKSAPH